jgi:hypothetical protein
LSPASSCALPSGQNTRSLTSKLRQALEDSAERPKFVETLPKFCYRFIAPVEWVADASGKSPLPRVVPIAPPLGHYPFLGKIAPRGVLDYSECLRLLIGRVLCPKCAKTSSLTVG